MAVDPRKTTRAYRIRRIVLRGVLYTVLIIGGIIAITPFLWMLSTSLMTLGEAISGRFLPETPQWQNYVIAWKEANFSEYFINSIEITLITLAGNCYSAFWQPTRLPA